MSDKILHTKIRKKGDYFFFSDHYQRKGGGGGQKGFNGSRKSASTRPHSNVELRDPNQNFKLKNYF